MYQIDVASAATTLPASSAAGTPGFFTDGNPATGVQATIVPAEFMNSLMLEILNVLAAASIAPAKGNHAQLLAAITAIVMASAAPAATTDTAGVVELATAEEGIAGTDTVRAIAPAVLAAVLASYAKSADVQTSIQTAIAALVDSSPAALNTLNELATALGDDPNFATTVTNAIAGKQAASANLVALAALVGAANQLPYFTAEGAMALTAFTAFARTLAGAADDLAARTMLGACGIVGPVSQVLSGTAVDISGIPSWAKKITITFDGAQTSAAANFLVQMNGIASGYFSRSGQISSASITSTAGLLIRNYGGVDINTGAMVLVRAGTRWVCEHLHTVENADGTRIGTGKSPILGDINTIRITTDVPGTTLTGSVSILIEG